MEQTVIDITTPCCKHCMDFEPDEDAENNWGNCVQMLHANMPKAEYEVNEHSCCDYYQPI